MTTRAAGQFSAQLFLARLVHALQPNAFSCVPMKLLLNCLLLFLCSAITASAADAQAPTPYPQPDPSTIDPLVKASAYGTKSVWSYSGGAIPWTWFHPHDFGSCKIDFNGDGVTPVGTVPAPGVHPRIFFSPEDLPKIRERIKTDRGAHEAWLNVLEYANAMKLTYDEKADYAKPDWLNGGWGMHGRCVDMHRIGGYSPKREDYYALLVDGKMPVKTYGTGSVANFFLPASAEAYRCLIDDDAAGGAKLATAVVNAIKLEQARRAKEDKPVQPGEPPKPSTPRFACCNLGLIYDFDYNFMTPEQRQIVHDELVLLSAWADNYGTFNNANASRSNWATFTYWVWDLMAIQGEPGFNDLKFLGLYRGWRDFYSYSFFDSGAAYEGEGKLLFGMDAAVAFDRVAPQYGLPLITQHPLIRKHYSNFTAMSVLPTQDKYAKFDILGGMGGGLCTPQDLVVAHYLYPKDKTIDFVYRTMVGDDYHNLPNAINQAWNNLITSAVFATSFDLNNTPDKLGLPESFFCGQRAVLMTRTSWDKEASMLTMHVRGASGGHPFRDRNGIMFSGAGRTWITIPVKDIGSWACDTVLIDQAEQNSSTPGRVVEYENTPDATFMVGDSKYCWDWVWNRADKTKDGKPVSKADVDSGNVGGLGWELLNQSFNDFAYTKSDWAIYQMPLKYTPSWIAPDGQLTPYMRQVNSPVLRCFRTAGVVRGPHAYALVVDDIQRDAMPCRYDWNVSLPDDVVVVPGYHGNNDVLLAGKTSIDPAKGTVNAGEPEFLVRVLSCQGKQVPIQVEQKDPKSALNILSITTTAVAPDYRVLLYANHAGEPLPVTQVTPSDAGMTVSVQFPDQQDTITMTPSTSGKTDLVVSRAGKELVAVNKPVEHLNDPASDALTQGLMEIPKHLAQVRQNGFDPTKLDGFVAGWHFDKLTQAAYAPLAGSDPTAVPVPVPDDAKPVEGMNGMQAIGTAKKPLKVALGFAAGMKGQPFTVALWLKTKSEPWMGSLISFNGRAFSMGIVQSNASISGGGVGNISSSPNTMLSSWTQFVIAADGTKMTLYRNGNALWTSPMDATKTNLGSELSLGGDNGYGDAETSIQNLYIYKTCLPADQVENLYVSEKYASLLTAR